MSEFWSVIRFSALAFIIISLFSSSVITKIRSGGRSFLCYHYCSLCHCGAFPSVANSMMSDYQPSMGDKTYTFNDVQGVSMHVCVCVLGMRIIIMMIIRNIIMIIRNIIMIIRNIIMIIRNIIMIGTYHGKFCYVLTHCQTVCRFSIKIVLWYFIFFANDHINVIHP